MTRYSWSLVALFLGFILCSCSLMDSSSDKKKVICNKLKSDIVFSGATADTRRAEIQSSEEPLIQRNYDANNCEDQ